MIARDPALARADGKLEEQRVVRTCSTAPSPPTPDASAQWMHGSNRSRWVERERQSDRAQDQWARRQRNFDAPVLVLAIAERLQQAGVKPGNILIWDRNARDPRGCGMTINTDPSRIRCYRHQTLRDSKIRHRDLGIVACAILKDSHPRMRHGHQPSDSQGSQHVGRHVRDEEYVWRRRAARTTPRRRLQSWRRRSQRDSRHPRKNQASPSATP